MQGRKEKAGWCILNSRGETRDEGSRQGAYSKKGATWNLLFSGMRAEHTQTDVNTIGPRESRSFYKPSTPNRQRPPLRHRLPSLPIPLPSLSSPYHKHRKQHHSQHPQASSFLPQATNDPQTTIDEPCSFAHLYSTDPQTLYLSQGPCSRSQLLPFDTFVLFYQPLFAPIPLRVAARYANFSPSCDFAEAIFPRSESGRSPGPFSFFAFFFPRTAPISRSQLES